MKDVDDWVELKSTLRLFTIWAVTTVIDSSFLALWVTIQWLVGSKVVTLLILTGIDKLVLYVFQVLFAISTLAPVGITIYRDIRIMMLRTQRRIRREIEIGETHESE
jgi:hypothetical protein